MATFNERLKELRAGSELTIRDLAEYIGVAKSTIHMYECGKREPSIATLEAIADFFNVDMDYLLGKSDCRNRYQESLLFPAGLPANPHDDFLQAVGSLARDMTEDEKRQLLLAARLIVAQRSEK